MKKYNWFSLFLRIAVWVGFITSMVAMKDGSPQEATYFVCASMLLMLVLIYESRVDAE